MFTNIRNADININRNDTLNTYMVTSRRNAHINKQNDTLNNTYAHKS